MTRFAVIAVAALLATSCAPSSGLNVQCQLVKKDPNAPAGEQRSAFITEADIKSNSNRDIISFGAVECEDLVCIREGGAPLTGNDSAFVPGWCSRPCLESAANACPSNDPALDKAPATAFGCRQLLLDEAQLAALRSADPATYKQNFGDTTSPFFCARAAVETAAP